MTENTVVEIPRHLRRSEWRKSIEKQRKHWNDRKKKRM